MRRFTTHSHTSASQKPTKRVHSELDNNESEHTGTRQYAINKLEPTETLNAICFWPAEQKTKSVLPSTPGVKFKGWYGPRDRLLLCRGASGYAQVTNTTCLTDAWKL